MLGSGTSTGVPRVGGDWGACDPAEPRNRRTRVSIIVENDAGSTPSSGPTTMPIIATVSMTFG
jgi:phosphoribosyl 1,2-cyclic phosphodiesterase